MPEFLHMAKEFVILVHLAMTFLLFAPGGIFSKNVTGFWLLNVRERHSISVHPDGRISSDPADTDLYNLFRVQTYQEGLASRLMFTLESMATNSFICMDEKGKVITKKRNQSRGKRKRSHPSNQCLFHSWNFGSNDWNPMIGIYLEVPRSNGTVGRFIAFNKHGNPRKCTRSLINLKKFLGIVITLRKPKSITKLVKRTRFQRCNGSEGSKSFNRGVRRCLEADQDVSRPNRLLRKSIFKVIQRCQEQVERNFCLKNLEARKNGRSLMPQDSKQRNYTSENPRFNQTEEEMDYPCPCAR